MRDLLILTWALILGILFAWSGSGLAIGLCLILLLLLAWPLWLTKKRSVGFLAAGLLLGVAVSVKYHALEIPRLSSGLECTFWKRSGISDFYLVQNRILEINSYTGDFRYDPPGKTLLRGQKVRLSGTFEKTAYALTGTLYKGHGIEFWIKEGPLPITARLDRWKNTLAQKLSLRLGAESGALASSLVLGTSDPILQERSDTLRYLGIIHILSISGFHVNLLEMILVRLRLKKASLAVILAYALLISSVPAWRAALMKASKETGRLLQRDSDGINQLLTAMAVLLVGRPYLLFSPSFQLTCAATAGLTALSHPLGAVFYRLPGGRIKDGLLLSLAAMIPCLPFLSALSFDLNLALFAANLLVVPLYSMFCLLAFFSLPAALMDQGGLFYILAGLMDGLLRITGLLEFLLANYLSVRVSYEGARMLLWLALLFRFVSRQEISAVRQALVMVICCGILFQATFLPGTTRVLFHKARGQARLIIRRDLHQFELVTESMYKSGVRRSAVPVEGPALAGDVILLPQSGDFPAVHWQGQAIRPMSDPSSDIIEEEYLLVLGKRIRLK